MNKTAQLIAAVKSGTHRIDQYGHVLRRAAKDHPFSGTRAGDWITANGWRSDVVRRAASHLKSFN